MRAQVGKMADIMDKPERKPKPGAAPAERRKIPPDEIKALGEMADFLVQLPYQWGGLLTQCLTDVDPATVKQLWTPDPQETLLAGKALRLLMVRHADEMIDKLPTLVLGATLGMGLVMRSAVAYRLHKDVKNAPKPGPAPTGETKPA